MGSFPLVRLFGCEMPGYAYLKTRPKPPITLNAPEITAIDAWTTTKRYWQADELTQGTWWFFGESGQKFLAQLSPGPSEARTNGFVIHQEGPLKYDDFSGERMVYKRGKWALPEETFFARPTMELWLYIDRMIVVCVASKEGDEHSAIAFDATGDTRREPAACTYMRVVHLAV